MPSRIVLHNSGFTASSTHLSIDAHLFTRRVKANHSSYTEGRNLVHFSCRCSNKLSFFSCLSAPIAAIFMLELSLYPPLHPAFLIPLRFSCLLLPSHRPDARCQMTISHRFFLGFYLNQQKERKDAVTEYSMESDIYMSAVVFLTSLVCGHRTIPPRSFPIAIKTQIVRGQQQQQTKNL